MMVLDGYFRAVIVDWDAIAGIGNNCRKQIILLSEAEFKRYLQEVIEEQDAIERIPMKCRYKVWSMTHWAEGIRNGSTSVTVDLLSTKGQV